MNGSASTGKSSIVPLPAPRRHVRLGGERAGSAVWTQTQHSHSHINMNDLSADADLWVCSVGGDPAHIRRKLDIIVGQGLPPLELLRSSKLAERESRQDSRLPGSLGSRAGPSAATPHSRVPEVTS